MQHRLAPVKYQSADEAYEGLNKRLDAAYLEIENAVPPRSGRISDLWKQFSDDTRRLVWAWYLNDTVRDWAELEGMEYRHDPLFYWTIMALHGCIGFYGIEVRLSELPPAPWLPSGRF